MNKARITYRFDEPERGAVRKPSKPVIPLFKEEFTVIEEERPQGVETPVEEPSPAGTERSVHSAGRGRREWIDTQPLNQFTTDFGAWKSPFDAETERVERMIRQSEPVRRSEPAAERNYRPDEPDDREGPFVDPSSGYYEEKRPHAGFAQEPVAPMIFHTRDRTPSTPWLKIVVSVSGAIATGVLIGFFVLSMFGGEDVLQNGSDAAKGSGGTVSAATPQTKAPSDAAGAKDNTAPVSSNAASTVSANIPAQSYTLLQNGVFSNQQGADAAVAELQKQGLAAFVQPSDKFYVYVGMAPSHDDALALSQLLKDQNMEVFLKALPLPAASKIKWSGEQGATAEQFFAQTQKLVQTIGGFAAARLKEKTPSAIDDATLQTIQTAHQAWTGVSGPFGAGLAAEQKATLQKWTTAMNTAVASMSEYKKNPAPAFLWEAQSSLMQVLFAENDLLAAIKTQ